jgi:uncharacterized protein (TIGR03086 family)
MALELFECFDRATRGFGELVGSIRPEQWSAATPCSEWDVRALVNHVVVEQLWAPFLLDGATLVDVGDRFAGDQLGADPVGAWARASRASCAAFAAVSDALEKPVHVSYGVTDVASYGWEMTADLVIHAWDLARGIDGDDRLEPELVAVSWEYLSPKRDMIIASELVGPVVPVPDDADLQDRLLGLMGRRA